MEQKIQSKDVRLAAAKAANIGGMHMIERLGQGLRYHNVVS